MYKYLKNFECFEKETLKLSLFSVSSGEFVWSFFLKTNKFKTINGRNVKPLRFPLFLTFFVTVCPNRFPSDLCSEMAIIDIPNLT